MDMHLRVFLAMTNQPTLDALRDRDLEEQRRRDAAKPVDRPLPIGIHKTLFEALGGDVSDVPAGAHQRLTKALVG